jgi:hypothetical protein
MGNTKSKRDTDNDYMHRLDTNLVTVLTLFNMDPKSGYLQSEILDVKYTHYMSIQN